MTTTANGNSTTEAPTPIIVWCIPRSCSTAFERAFMQRQDTRCFHEPTGGAYYYGPERACQRYDEEACQKSGESHKTVVETLKDMLRQAEYDRDTEKKEPAKFIFSKDMAQYLFSGKTLAKLHPDSTVYGTKGSPPSANADVDGKSAGDRLRETLENPTVVPIDLLRRFKHTFLVRTPLQSVPSYYKCVQDKAAGFEFYDPSEAGYAELRIFYQWLANPESTFHTAPVDTEQDLPGVPQQQPQPPPLVDAAVLLADPERTISAYCDAVGVPFDKGMLSWESKKVSEFSAWGSFHAQAEQSTGFKKPTPISDAAKAAANGDAKEKKKDLPKEVTQTIQDTMEDYNWLFERRSIRNEE